jgi:multidrug efflux pump subunit AcrA (membrane-fusion protein)
VLVPGMYAEVKLITAARRNVLTVPIEAVDGAGDLTRVFTVAPPGEIHIVPVSLGIQTAREVEIHSGDLKDGDDVVVGPRSGLKEGAKVRPKVISLAAGLNAQ